MNNEKRASLVEFGGLDTTLVLFFLALEYGRGADVFSTDGAMMGITLVVVLALPYFLPSRPERTSCSSWLLGRAILASAAFLLGIGIDRMAGTLLPEAIGFLPMTFLVLASIAS